MLGFVSFAGDFEIPMRATAWETTRWVGVSSQDIHNWLPETTAMLRRA